eukprot:938456-Pleurochrysis_carterae.AAC.1
MQAKFDPNSIQVQSKFDPKSIQIQPKFKPTSSDANGVSKILRGPLGSPAAASPRVRWDTAPHAARRARPSRARRP